MTSDPIARERNVSGSDQHASGAAEGFLKRFARADSPPFNRTAYV
jgi:hypothetical protein